MREAKVCMWRRRERQRAGTACAPSSAELCYHPSRMENEAFWHAIAGTRMQDDEEVVVFSGKGEAFMDVPGIPAGGARRNEDIALDLMKFIAMTTGYGKPTTPGGGVGFEKLSGGTSKPDEYATHLLELYGKCLDAVGSKK